MAFFGCSLIYSLRFSGYLRRLLSSRNGNINFCLFWSSCFKQIWSHNHNPSWEPFMKKPWPVFDWKLPLYCDQRIFNDFYRGTGFLVVVWFGSLSTPSHPLLSVSSNGDTEEDCKRETGRGGRGAETYDRQVLYKSFNTLWLQLLYMS